MGSLVRNGTATGSGRHSGNCQRRGRLAGIATPQRRQQSPFTSYTTDRNGSPVNRVERWKLFCGGKASRDRIIIDNIPVAQYHDGGRIRFGSDGMLYVGTGDARIRDLPERQQSVRQDFV